MHSEPNRFVKPFFLIALSFCVFLVLIGFQGMYYAVSGMSPDPEAMGSLTTSQIVALYAAVAAIGAATGRWIYGIIKRKRINERPW